MDQRNGYESTHHLNGRASSAGFLRVAARLSLVLAFLLVLSAPGTASAAGNRTDYDLDDDGFIEIDDLEDLDELRYSPDGSTLYGSDAGCPAGGCQGVELTQDLDFDTDGDGDFDWNGATKWIPISRFGSFDITKKAIFAGNGHTIRTLVVASDSSSSGGLFTSLENAVVQDLGIEGAYVDTFSSNPMGILANTMTASGINRCHTSGNLVGVGNEFYVGGLVGTCENGVISESYAQVDIVAGDSLGGLVGASAGCSIIRSFATGRIESAYRRHNVGGLVGMMLDSSVTQCFATGNVVTSQTAGGLIGSAVDSSVLNCFATGRLIGPELPRGGLIGTATNTATVSSYFASDLSGETQSAGGAGFTAAELKCPQSPSDPGCASGLYAGWGSALNDEGEPVWDFGNAQQLPGLNIQGAVFRDSDGDATLDTDDDYPLVYAAASDADGDGAHDRWKEGCDDACRQASGLTLDQFTDNDAASVDLDLDDRPDTWNAGCNFFCRIGSGLIADQNLGDQDNDGLSDSLDDDDDNDGTADTDADSDGLIDIESITELDAIRYDLTGRSQRFGENAESDSSGCPPRLHDGVLARVCSGYELLQDLNFDENQNGTLQDDPIWNFGAEPGEGWQPIGRNQDNPALAFSSVLDGNGHTLYNLLANTRIDQVGLFGGARDATIRHLGLEGPLMLVHSDNGPVGALIGHAVRTEVRGVRATGAVTSNGDNTGGLVGHVSRSTIIGSLSTGLVSTTSCASCRVGGIAGSAAASLIAASFSTATIVGDDERAGGLVGDSTQDTLITGCYSTGIVVAALGGGLIGTAESNTENSYWATDSSTKQLSAGNPVGVLRSELQCPVASDSTNCAAVPLFVDWDSYLDENDAQYWRFGDSSKLPGLCVAGTLYRDADGDSVLDEPRSCAVLQQQLVTNTGFEANTSGWIASPGASIATSTLQAHSGARSLRVTNRTQPWQGAEYNLLGVASPGDTLEASLWVRIAGDPSEPAKFTLRSTCQGASPTYTTVASGTATDTGWVQLTGSVQVPSCTHTGLAVYAEGPRAGVQLFIDDVSVTREVDQASLGGNFIVLNDWGSGYCAELRVTNTTSTPTRDWSATFPLNGTTLNDIWNLDTSANTGTVTMSPAATWSQILQPGQSTHSLGFCATRPQGSSALPGSPTVTGAF